MFLYVLIILLGAGSSRETLASKTNLMSGTCETLPSTIHITKGKIKENCFSQFKIFRVNNRGCIFF